VALTIWKMVRFELSVLSMVVTTPTFRIRLDLTPSFSALRFVFGFDMDALFSFLCVCDALRHLSPVFFPFFNSQFGLVWYAQTKFVCAFSANFRENLLGQVLFRVSLE